MHFQNTHLPPFTADNSVTSLSKVFKYISRTFVFICFYRQTIEMSERETVPRRVKSKWSYQPIPQQPDKN